MLIDDDLVLIQESDFRDDGWCLSECDRMVTEHTLVMLLLSHLLLSILQIIDTDNTNSTVTFTNKGQSVLSELTRNDRVVFIVSVQTPREGGGGGVEVGRERLVDQSEQEREVVMEDSDQMDSVGVFTNDYFPNHYVK